MARVQCALNINHQNKTNETSKNHHNPKARFHIQNPNMGRFPRNAGKAMLFARKGKPEI